MAMQIPQYWAEARVQEKFGRGHVSGRVSLTVRRFGWSDASLAEAQAMADARAREAFDRILAGEALSRHEPRVPYDAEGLPIREQIVERHGDIVITRNSYGARCLNSPEVLFADVDFQPPRYVWSNAWAVGLAVASLASGAWMHWTAGVLVFLFGLFVLGYLSHRVGEYRHRHDQGGPEARAMAPVKAFVQAHPDWHLRVYRTPNGFRLLAMHRVFDPLDPQVTAFFRAIGADDYYALLCQHQHCFRARVSPKPWRIGMRDRIPPGRAAWPVPAERMAEREAWIHEYEALSGDFAACRFVESLGSRDYVAATQSVQRLHDALCRAERPSLPMA